MDADRFEALLRTLSRSPSRRGVLRLLAGSSVGGLLTLGALPTGAKKKKKKKKKKVTVCHSGQTLQIRRSALVAHLTHGDTFGPCPASPPPPPPPPPPPSTFCTGKNECVSSPARCEASGPECFCWVTFGAEEPFCGQQANILNDCDACIGDEVCVDASGECFGVSGCSAPCPSPQS